MTGAFRHVAAGTPVVVTSPITGRSLRATTQLARFLIPPTLNVAGLEAAHGDWLDWLTRLTRPSYVQCSALRHWAEESLFSASDVRGFGTAVDTIAATLLLVSSSSQYFESKSISPVRPGVLQLRRGDAKRLSELLLVLRKNHCLLAPAIDVRQAVFSSGRYGADTLLQQGAVLLGPSAQFIRDVVSEASPRDRRIVITPALKLVLAIDGICEVGDLCTETLQPLLPVFAPSHPDVLQALAAASATPYDVTQRHRKFFAALQRAQIRHHPEQAALIPPDYHSVRGSPGTRARRKGRPNGERKSVELDDLASQYPDHKEWFLTARDHIAAMDNRIDLGIVLSTIRTALRHLLMFPELPVSPVAFCRTGYNAVPLLKSVIFVPRLGASSRGRYISELRAYFDHIITSYCQLPSGVADPEYRNPALGLPQPRRNGRGQTHRIPLPPWLVRAARDLIVSDDYAWPRTREADYFLVPTESGVARIWSPVLAEYTLLRFLLPLRPLQARLLGSGEGDAWTWQEGSSPGEGIWVENTGRWRPAAGEDRGSGFLRRMWDPERGVWTTGLYISTNKTADRENGWDDQGYVVPWCSPDIIDLFSRVIRFQHIHNPPQQPKNRAELYSESTLASSDVIQQLPRMHYLFRDRCDRDHPDEPVTRGRIRRFWLDMMRELETRIKNDPHGRRNDDGTPVQLLRASRQSAHFDLHSVRVTGITALVVNGCPLHVVVMLAGHASWIMTLYYTKPSAAEVKSALDAANERIAAAEAGSWADWMGGIDAEVLDSLRIANSSVGIDQLEAHQSALSSHMDHGVCPNGGSMCHQGGERDPVSREYSPVPGGATNCQCCRFFVTGPQFLGGLIARLNKLSADVLDAGQRLRDAEARRRGIIAAARTDGTEGDALNARLRRSEAAVDEAERSCEYLGTSWQRLLELTQRCETALREYTARREQLSGVLSPNMLVLNGTPDDFGAALEECSEYELWSRICEDSEVYSFDATNAGRRRGARIDHILGQVDQPAVFAALSDREAIEVGNVFGRWLRTRLQPAELSDVVEGRRTLRDAGLLPEVNSVLTKIVGPRATATSLQPGRPGLLTVSSGAESSAVRPTT
jgi:hypothetical protein